MATLTILVLAVLSPLAAAVGQEDTTATNLTLHNLCPYTVWPLITPNMGLPAISDGEEAATRLDGHGDGLATLAFPPGAWSGSIVARTGCSDDEDDDVDVDAGSSPSVRCRTGDAPPMTVAQVSVHGAAGGLAEYSVSLVDGFNVPMVVTPHGFERARQCPSLGCAVDLNVDCPSYAKAPAGGCTAQGQVPLFKQRCPDTRTTPTDVEGTPQHCLEPGELKVVFCPATSS